MEATTVSMHEANEDREGYDAFLTAIGVRFGVTTTNDARLFTTDATGLFDLFLDGLPADRRRHYDCRACRRFVERFGGLVTIAADGLPASVIWDPFRVPEFFRRSVGEMARVVGRANVDGVFLCDEKVWGLPENRSQIEPFLWKHMAIRPPKAMVHRPTPVLATSQAVAEKREECGMLARGLAEFSIDHARKAHSLLLTGSLYRSEKCEAIARWFLDLHERLAGTKNSAHRKNLIWSAVAPAPAGFCHVKGSMIGSLLEDIAADMPFEQIKRRFDEKMNPMQYRRPQAPPSAQNVAQAEAIVERLRTAGALARRFARLEDVKAIWAPKPTANEETKPGNVFGHLLPKSRATSPAKVEQLLVTMTWEKFARTVLPTAEQIELLVPTGKTSLGALVTAKNVDAPPIIAWDREEQRNPVSWYFYVGGSFAEDWRLARGYYARVNAVTLAPPMWNENPIASHGEGVFFLLEGAKDDRKSRGATGGGFFPEILRSEYHGVRKTMEAYANAAVVEDAEGATTCGIGLMKSGNAWGQKLRVTSRGTTIEYSLDRWD